MKRYTSLNQDLGLMDRQIHWTKGTCSEQGKLTNAICKDEVETVEHIISKCSKYSTSKELIKCQDKSKRIYRNCQKKLELH